MEVLDLKVQVEALLKKPNQQLSSPIKRKGNDDKSSKQTFALKVIRLNMI